MYCYTPTNVAQSSNLIQMHFEIYIKLVYVNATLFYTTNLILTNLMQRGADLGTI